MNKSNLTGIVRDGTGAAVPGVAIKLANVGTGAVRTEASDASGFYRFTLVRSRRLSSGSRAVLEKHAVQRGAGGAGKD